MRNILVAIALFLMTVTAVFGQSDVIEYVGQYQVTGAGLLITISAEAGKLFAQATGQPKAELESGSDGNFTLKGAPVKVTFQRNATGKVTGMVINQSGVDVEATKINASAEAPRDKSPHKSEFVTANGIKMNYLDWGGTGDVVILLSGFGNDAHIFDDFAPSFTDKFHVIGLTRRGFGETERPVSGYDTSSRVEDIRAFMDALKISRAHLVGHSLAGDEMTLLATLHPKRLLKMVYLDAAYDRTKMLTCADELPPEIAPPAAIRMMREAMNCPGWADIEVKQMPPPDLYNVQVSTMKSASQFRPVYSKIKTPSLAVYADPEVAQLPGNLSDDTRKRLEAYWKENRTPRTRASIEQFRKEMKTGEVVEVKGATHYVFLGLSRDQTIKLAHDFLVK